MTETSALQFLGYVKASEPAAEPTNDIDLLCEGDKDVVELIPIYRGPSQFAAIYFQRIDVDDDVERRSLFLTAREAAAFCADTLGRDHAAKPATE